MCVCMSAWFYAATVGDLGCHSIGDVSLVFLIGSHSHLRFRESPWEAEHVLSGPSVALEPGLSGADRIELPMCGAALGYERLDHSRPPTVSAEERAKEGRAAALIRREQLRRGGQRELEVS